MKRFAITIRHKARQVLLGIVAVAAISFVSVGDCGAIASPLNVQQANLQQPVVAYNIDFGMDLARVEQTIEHYGEEIREVVEQALLNNVNHPESKETAENSYQRQSTLNDLLPEARSSAFSKDELTQLRKTEHPRERLR